MRRRFLSTSLVALVCVASAAPAWSASPRYPQVPVSGTALAEFFASQGQTIDVNTEQLNLQTLSVPMSTTFEVRQFGPDNQRRFGAYPASPTAHAVWLIYPGFTTPDAYETFAFITTPSRLVVNLFNAAGTFQGSSTYVTGPSDPSFFGFYHQAPGINVYFSEDYRNPLGEAKILAYYGTGARVGWTWFACETGAGPGGDYADFIALVNLTQGPVPVTRTTWGTLKQRFR